MMPRNPAEASAVDRQNAEAAAAYGGPGPAVMYRGAGGAAMGRGGYGGGTDGPLDSYSRQHSERMGMAPITTGGGGGGGGSGGGGRYSQDVGSPTDAGMGYGSHMDMGHHPSMMGYGASMGGYAAVDMDSRGLMASRGRNSRPNGGGSQPGISGAPGPVASSASGVPGPAGASGAANRGSLSQAEREEELLLNLLIARRQRGRTGAQGEPSPALREELMRLRQQSGIDPHTGAGGSMAGGGMAGMMPMYDPTTGMISGGNSRVAAGYSQGDTGDQRVDRASHYMIDARAHDMMGYGTMGGGMGMGAGPGGNMAGTKRSAAAMAYDPSGYGATGAAQMKYPPYGMIGHPQGPPMGHPQGMHAPASMGAMAPSAGQLMGPGGGGAMPPPSKKRRSHKKKPADMPRRPLSAYNLFFSEERERILNEIGGKDGEDKEEGVRVKEVGNDEEQGADEKKESEKPKALLRPLVPNLKKRRPHRKTHGKISFQQLARMVGERWKALPDERRKYYQELAQEDMKRQKDAMEEYYAKQQVLKDGTGIKSDEADDDEPLVHDVHDL